jgi:hypothetical protein
MTKSGFMTAQRIVFGTAFAAVLAFGCSDYNSNNNPPYTGTGGFVQCITYGPTGGAAGTTTGTGGAGATGVDGGNNNDDGGTVACNPNGTGTGGSGNNTATGNGGTTTTTGAGGTGTTRGPRPY